jgi:hypothetical protein
MGYLRFFIHHHRNKYFAENAVKADVLWGGTIAGHVVTPLLEPWRVEVALLVEGAPRH